MDCTAFDERLADYLEGDLAPAERRQVEAHLVSCSGCAALVRDLEEIRVGASALTDLMPSRDLWNDLANRIEAPVVPLTTRSTANVTVRRTFDRVKLGAIAAALVAVTAGVTYLLTVAENRSATMAPDVAVVAPLTSPDSNNSTVVRPQPPVAAIQSPVAPRASSAQPVRNVPAAVTYSREIDRLRTIFQQSRAQLDPRTAAIIEANLKVIDDAIAQSRAALAQDPASRFLTDQLNSALDKKLELLRTATLLPNRT
jgi:anti-sigma factor RsiW